MLLAPTISNLGLIAMDRLKLLMELPVSLSIDLDILLVMLGTMTTSFSAIPTREVLQRGCSPAICTRDLLPWSAITGTNCWFLLDTLLYIIFVSKLD